MAYPANGQPHLRQGAVERPPLAAPIDPSLALDALWPALAEPRPKAPPVIGVDAGRGGVDDRGRRVEELGIEPSLAAITRQVLVDYVAELRTRPKQKGAGSLSRHSVQRFATALPLPPSGGRARNRKDLYGGTEAALVANWIY